MNKNIKLTDLLLENNTKFILSLLTEGSEGEIINKISKLSQDLKKDGEDVTNIEVQAAMLDALLDAGGKLDQVKADDVESVKQKIKEGRGYKLEESSAAHALEGVGLLLGNAAFLHTLAAGIEKITHKKVNEDQLKQKLKNITDKIKTATGYPAKVMSKFFSLITKGWGGGEKSQKIAGLAGSLIVTIIFLSIGIALFPSISSWILFILAIGSFIGKGAEIFNLGKGIWRYIKEMRLK
jgi:hypothetical protein